MARLLRDLGVVKLLIDTGAANGIGEQFEFALALLDGSRGGSTSERTVAARMAANRTQDASALVLLFKGCVTEGLFKRVNQATRRVLEVNGSEVRVPQTQFCCGALHAHAGDLEGARALARKNIDAFADGDALIVTNAGGCGAMLASYAPCLPR
jgi:glycolate oxidase iron-sulfur subunit